MLILHILLLVALLFAAFCFFGGWVLFRLVFDRRASLPAPKGAPEENPLMAPTGAQLDAFLDAKRPAYRAEPFESLSLRSFDGLTLFACLLRGKDPTLTVICVHGYRSSPESDFCAILDIYRALGCNVLLVEDRGHGRSGGRYIGFSEPDRFDVAAWAQEMADRFPGTDIILHGMSMGAATVLHTADMPLVKNVCGIISDCGFTSIRAETKHQARTIFRMPYFPLGYVAGWYAAVLAHAPMTRSDSVRCVARTKLPVALICGTQDQYIPHEMTQAIYDAAAGPKRILWVPGAGHAASYLCAPDAYTALVTEFIAAARHKTEEPV